MQIRATGMILTSLVSLGLAMLPAIAQPAVTSTDRVLIPASETSSVVEPAPAPLTSPVPAANHNVITPPGVCRILSGDECAHTATACLKARTISHLYAVEWRSGDAVVVRVQDGMTDAQEKGARGCAADLQKCLAGKC